MASILPKLTGAGTRPGQPNVTADGGVGSGRDIINSPITFGVSETILRDTLAIIGTQASTVATSTAENAALRDAIDEGVPRQSILDIAFKIAPDVSDRQGAITALERAAEEIVRLRAEVASGSNYSALVDEAVRRILERTEARDLEGASEVAAEAFARWQRDETERRDAARAAGIKLADENRGARYRLGDADGAAEWIARGLELYAGEASLDALDAAAHEYWERGRDKGLNLDLEIAAALAEQALARPGLDADQRGNWWNNLGLALATLGQREAGTARLDAAVRAYEAALIEWTRERAPLQWAMTQNNLGDALRVLAERTGDAAVQARAIAAYEGAIEVFRAAAATYYLETAEAGLARVRALLAA